MYGDILGLLRIFSELILGLLMVQSTKMVIAHVSTAELNPKIEPKKFTDFVISTERKIYILVLINLSLIAADGFYWYFALDNFLEKEF